MAGSPLSTGRRARLLFTVVLLRRLGFCVAAAELGDEEHLGVLITRATLFWESLS